VHVNNAGEFILVPLIGDQKIILGNARRLENKFDRLKTFYKKAMPYVGWQQYRSINLKFNGQVVCKR
jgi:cell division protein FtsQ